VGITFWSFINTSSFSGSFTQSCNLMVRRRSILHQRHSLKQRNVRQQSTPFKQWRGIYTTGSSFWRHPSIGRRDHWQCKER
jgi:hypothetical protein